MCMGGRKSIADVACIGMNRHAGGSPVGELVGTVSDASARNRSVKDEWFKFADFHALEDQCEVKGALW